jgi:uncharacterized membrane protein YoaK (UPF0700 family)
MPYSERERDRIQRFARIDPLIFLGGVCLAFVAGFVNSISLCYFHVPVSHMTGAVTRLSIDMAGFNFSELINLSYIVSGFLIGAIFSGTVIGARNFKPAIEYSFLMAVESALLFASVFLFKSKANSALFFVAFACGLQNAMASNYMGLIIRTTHVTGIVTDLGVLIGQALRHQRVRFWKIGFLVSILIGFFAGGLAGFSIFRWISFYANFVPAAMCLIGAAGFYALRVRKRRVPRPF